MGWLDRDQDDARRRLDLPRRLPDGRGGRIALLVPAPAAGADLPTALRRLLDQGAALSLPYMVAAGSRRSADGRFGAAGRGAPEGRRLRVLAVQPGDDPPGDHGA